MKKVFPLDFKKNVLHCQCSLVKSLKLNFRNEIKPKLRGQGELLKLTSTFPRKNKALVLLAKSTGCRRSDLERLRYNDFSIRTANCSAKSKK